MSSFDVFKLIEDRVSAIQGERCEVEQRNAAIAAWMQQLADRVEAHNRGEKLPTVVITDDADRKILVAACRENARLLPTQSGFEGLARTESDSDDVVRAKRQICRNIVLQVVSSQARVLVADQGLVSRYSAKTMVIAPKTVGLLPAK